MTVDFDAVARHEGAFEQDHDASKQVGDEVLRGETNQDAHHAKRGQGSVECAADAHDGERHEQRHDERENVHHTVEVVERA